MKNYKPHLAEKIYIYIHFCIILLLTSSSPCLTDQFAVSYFSTSVIVLFQVYNWEISLVCCCVLADIFYIFCREDHRLSTEGKITGRVVFVLQLNKNSLTTMGS